MTQISSAPYAVSEVAVGQYTFHVAENGDPKSQPVFWLHGSGPGVTSLSNWEDTIAALPQYRNICPDILGFGESSHPNPPPDGMGAWTDLRAETMVGLMDALRIPKAHFVGNSMGGMITLNILKRFPQRVEKFVLMGSGGAPVPPGPALSGLMSYYDDPTTERLLSMLTQFVYDKDAMAGRLKRVAEARLPLTLREDIKRSHLTTFTPGTGVRRPLVTEEDFANIAQAGLVLHGRDDQMVQVASSYWLAEHLPNAQLHVFPRTGHWTQIEQPERFQFLVDSFFQGLL